MQERRAVAPLTGGRHRLLLATAVVAVVVVAGDQATKSWALADLHRRVHLLGPFGLALQYNSGTAFSLLPGAGDWLIPLVVVLVGGVAWLAWRARRTVLAVAYGLVLGGALGNLADRVARGHHGDVVDFVTLSHWPTFNVADACITIGVLLVVLAVLGVAFPHRRARRPPGDERGPDDRPGGGPRGPQDAVDASSSPSW